MLLTFAKEEASILPALSVREAAPSLPARVDGLASPTKRSVTESLPKRPGRAEPQPKRSWSAKSARKLHLDDESMRIWLKEAKELRNEVRAMRSNIANAHRLQDACADEDSSRPKQKDKLVMQSVVDRLTAPRLPASSAAPVSPRPPSTPKPPSTPRSPTTPRTPTTPRAPELSQSRSKRQPAQPKDAVNPEAQKQSARPREVVDPERQRRASTESSPVKRERLRRASTESAASAAARNSAAARKGRRASKESLTSVEDSERVAAEKAAAEKAAEKAAEERTAEEKAVADQRKAAVERLEAARHALAAEKAAEVERKEADEAFAAKMAARAAKMIVGEVHVNDGDLHRRTPMGAVPLASLTSPLPERPPVAPAPDVPAGAATAPPQVLPTPATATVLARAGSISSIDAHLVMFAAQMGLSPPVGETWLSQLRSLCNQLPYVPSGRRIDA